MGLKAGYAGHGRPIFPYNEPQNILNAAITDRQVKRGKLTSPAFLVRDVALSAYPRAQVRGIHTVQRNVTVGAIYSSLKVSKQMLRMPAAYQLEVRNLRGALHIYMCQRAGKCSF